jgi:hypothetical protein
MTGRHGRPAARRAHRSLPREYFVGAAGEYSARHHHVRGSNFVLMSVHADRVPNRAIIMTSRTIW